MLNKISIPDFIAKVGWLNASYAGSLLLSMHINHDVEVLTKLIGFEPDDNSKNEGWDGKSRYSWCIEDENARVCNIYTMRDDCDFHLSGSLDLVHDIVSKIPFPYVITDKQGRMLWKGP